jgi:predicted dehydrogenase
MVKKTVKIGIIGFGNIGKKRFLSLKEIKKFKINIVYIVDIVKPKNLSSKISYFKNWEDVSSIDVDLIIISTPTKQSEIIVNEFCEKFNILVEKPLSNNLKKIKKYIKRANKSKKLLKVGYNLRYDDGIITAKNFLNKNLIGKIYYIKISYANGAAKTNTNEVGSLLDMGTHSINLLTWLTNVDYFKVIKSISKKNEFLNRTKIDNGFILLESKNIQAFIHHGFCTWKNIFDLEIIGTKGLIRINSLSKWKNQIVILGIRKYPDGEPKLKEWLFKVDNSWKNELLFVFSKIIKKNKNYIKINEESINTIKIINKII